LGGVVGILGFVASNVDSRGWVGLGSLAFIGVMWLIGVAR
jgi:hypothetical protein